MIGKTDLKYSRRVLGRICMFRSSVECAHKHQFVGRKRETTEKFSGRSAGRNRTETVIGRILRTTGNIEWDF